MQLHSNDESQASSINWHYDEHSSQLEIFCAASISILDCKAPVKQYGILCNTCCTLTVASFGRHCCSVQYFQDDAAPRWERIKIHAPSMLHRLAQSFMFGHATSSKKYCSKFCTFWPHSNLSYHQYLRMPRMPRNENTSNENILWTKIICFSWS